MLFPLTEADQMKLLLYQVIKCTITILTLFLRSSYTEYNCSHSCMREANCCLKSPSWLLLFAISSSFTSI